jgi:hypothetical protein
MPLRFLDENEEPAVKDLFKKLCKNKSEELKAEFTSEGVDGIPCSLPFWSMGMVNKQTEIPLEKLIPLPIGNTAQSMTEFLDTKRLTNGNIIFKNITKRMALRDGGTVPKVMEIHYKSEILLK